MPKQFQKLQHEENSQKIIEVLLSTLSQSIEENINSLSLPSGLAAVSHLATVEKAGQKSGFELAALSLICKVNDAAPKPAQKSKFVNRLEDFVANNQTGTIEWFHVLRGQKQIISSDSLKAILRIDGNCGHGIHSKQVFFGEGSGGAGGSGGARGSSINARPPAQHTILCLQSRQSTLFSNL